MEYAIFSQKYSRIAAKGSGVIVSFDYQQQTKVMLPSNWIERIKEIEQDRK